MALLAQELQQAQRYIDEDQEIYGDDDEQRRVDVAMPIKSTL